MDWKLLLTAFVTVFVAEIGDKTQLAVFALSADARASRWTLFAGASLGLILAAALAVLLGGLVGQAVSPDVMRWVAGLLFVAIGLWTLFAR